MEGSSQGGKGGFDFIKIDGLAKAIGTSEPGLRFLISLLIGKIGEHIGGNALQWRKYLLLLWHICGTHSSTTEI